MAKPLDVPFDTDIPPSESRPVYRMTADPPRYRLMRTLLDGELPVSRFSEESEAPKHRRLRVDASGAFEIYPNFKELGRLPAPEFPKQDVLKKVGSKIVGAVVPSDDFTTAIADEGRMLSHAKRDVCAPGEAEVPRPNVLMYVSARRQVGDLLVDGPGSRITIAVDAEGKVRGAVYDWKKPRPAGRIDAPDADMVKAKITEQLATTKARKGVRVKRVELAYYDNGETLQPVYRYVAELGQNCSSFGAADVLVGYVPFLNMPDASALGQIAAPSAGKPTSSSTQGRSLDVGRYVGRELSTGWHESSEDFWSALARAPGPLTFVNAQRAPAEPEMFAKDKDTHINRVDLALVEAHGFPMGFATLSDDQESVYIEQDVAPEHGYGSAAEGRLKHWILHSCNALSTEAEFPGWASEWAPIFKGLCSIVGYRSVMIVTDGAPAALAASLAADAPVVPAWFNAVTSLNIYARDSDVMLRCAGNRTLGRPSAIVAVDHAEATPCDAGPTKVSCLECWWIEDEIVTTASKRIEKVHLVHPEPKTGCPEEGDGGVSNFPKRKKKKR